MSVIERDDQLQRVLNAFREDVKAENAPAKVYELQSRIARLDRQLQGAVETLRAIQAICDDDRNTSLDVRIKVEHALVVGVTPGLNAGGQ